jgi:hypothetical protein
MIHTLGSASGFDPTVVTALIAAALAVVVLKVIAAEIDYARRWHALREEARQLRQKQVERLRRLQPSRR